MIADAAVTALRDAGLTVAAAESLTGGQVCVALSEAPGSSEVFVGGVVTYTVAAKERLLGVAHDLLQRVGPVDATVAAQMAVQVAQRAGADIGVSTTGVAGPQPHGGHPPGFAFIGWSVGGRGGAVEVRVDGDRATVRGHVTQVALEVVRMCVSGGVDVEQVSKSAQTLRRE